MYLRYQLFNDSDMHLFSHWIISALSVGIAATIVPHTTITIAGAFISAVVLGGLNIFIKPILFILTLPVTLITLGLFSIVINALLVWFASVLVPGFSVSGFVGAILFAIVLSLVNWVFEAWEK